MPPIGHMDWIGLGHRVDGLDWIGLRKLDPCPTLSVSPYKSTCSTTTYTRVSVQIRACTYVNVHIRTQYECDRRLGGTASWSTRKHRTCPETMHRLGTMHYKHGATGLLWFTWKTAVKRSVRIPVYLESFTLQESYCSKFRNYCLNRLSKLAAYCMVGDTAIIIEALQIVVVTWWVYRGVERDRREAWTASCSAGCITINNIMYAVKTLYSTVALVLPISTVVSGVV